MKTHTFDLSFQKLSQVFKRIHAAFVEASCNPFYTADSVRRGAGGGGGREKDIESFSEFDL